MVEISGIEPLTSCLTTVLGSQLSYTPRYFHFWKRVTIFNFDC